MAAARSTTSHAPNGSEIRVIALDHVVLDRVSVRIRRNRRSRHVRLHVDEQGLVTASIPQRFAAARLDPIVRERADWLHDMIVQMELKTRDTEVDLERGDPIRWKDEWIVTRLERCSGRRSSVEFDGSSLALRIPHDADEHDALIAWYRKQARTIFEQRVEYWAGEFGLEPGKVSIRNQRTRWGSCTFEGDLSFNWRLVLAPDWVLDSIVVHELCHIDELNHSDAFWALLDERYPLHERASDWLHEHGPGLRVTRPGTRTLTDARFATSRSRDDRAGSHQPPRSQHDGDDQLVLFGE